MAEKLGESSLLEEACRELLELDEWTLGFIESTLLEVTRSYMDMLLTHVKVSGETSEQVDQMLREFPLQFSSYLSGIYGVEIGLNLGPLLASRTEEVTKVIAEECMPEDDEETARKAMRLRRLIMQGNTEILKYLKEIAYQAIQQEK